MRIDNQYLQASLLMCGWFVSAPSAFAAVASATPPTTSLSLLKTLLGLVVVMAVMMFIAWLAKRYIPNIGAQSSVVRIVGGVNVGARERVVVLEVAGRWIVVGVGAGQVSSIANLEPGTPFEATATSLTETKLPAGFDKAIPSFAHWLKQSKAKFSEK